MPKELIAKFQYSYKDGESLNGTLSVAASYRLINLLSPNTLKQQAKEIGKTPDFLFGSLKREEREAIAIKFLTDIIENDDSAFRNEIVLLLDSVFEEFPEEDLVELEDDSIRTTNKKRNRQLNIISEILTIFNQYQSDILPQSVETPESLPNITDNYGLTEQQAPVEILQEPVDPSLIVDPSSLPLATPLPEINAGQTVDFANLPKELQELIPNN